MGDGEERKKGLFGRMFGRKDDAKDKEAKDKKDGEPANEPANEAGSAEAGAEAETGGGAGKAASTAVASQTAEQQAQPKAKRSWFGRLKDGLAKSSSRLGDSISGIFGGRKLNEDTLQELEDILIQADLGVDAAMRITETLAKTRIDKNVSTLEVQQVLAEEVEKVLQPVARPLQVAEDKKPFTILMVGVNGAGKTTTIGKLSRKFHDEGKKVMLAAGDTFRAAAVEQLVVWGDRTGAPVVKRGIGADAAGLAYDAMNEAREGGYDVLMMDTAGRLQNKAHLMEELKKIIRVMKKHDETAPHAVLLVLDATTGQNAVNQVKVFGEEVDVSGLVMTKLDGSARGGILVAISDRFGLPVHFIGVGEGVEDLQPFSATDFARAIAQIDDGA